MKLSNKNQIYETISNIQYYVNKIFTFVPSHIIDTKYGSFYSLNVREGHPSMESSETFYIDSNTLLRPHASNFQNIVIEKYREIINKYCSSQYIGFYNIGKVFRKDDSRMHHYCFNQCDILVFGPTASVSHLKDFYVSLLSFLDIDLEIRIRNSYFPFTNPSYEVDALKDGKYIEIAGMGITNTDHMKKHINKNIRAIASGMGIERLAFLKSSFSSIKEARRR